MKIVIFGHVCIDRNASEFGLFVGAGSPAMFMHRIFSQLPDCNVTIVSPYSKDFIPYMGMSRFYPETPFPGETMTYENTVVQGIRTQRCLNHQNANPVIIDDAVTQIIRAADAICIAPLAPNFPPSYIKQIASLKKWNTEITLLPQGYFRQFDADNTVRIREFVEDTDIIPLVDTVIMSDADYSDTRAIASKWALQSSAHIVMTQAEQGATLFSGADVTEVPTDPVAIQDIKSSIGAGDIFSAGYMYSHAKFHDPTRAVRFGNALAGQCLRFTQDTIVLDLPSLPV